MARLIHACVGGGRWMPLRFYCQTSELDMVGQNTHQRGTSLCLRRRSIIYPGGSVFLVQGFMPMAATMVVPALVLVCVCMSMVVTVAVAITMIVIMI